MSSGKSRFVSHDLRIGPRMAETRKTKRVPSMLLSHSRNKTSTKSHDVVQAMRGQG